MKEMLKKFRKAKGFTLVELLIVIIIIGILAGMMMLSGGSSTDAAEATKIISDLRSIKGAASMYYMDNSEWPTGIDPSMDQYMDQKLSDQDYDIQGGGSDPIVVLYTGTVSEGVAKKLADRAEKAGLTDSTGDNAYESGAPCMVIKR